MQISKVQGVFGKKYLPNWSREIFQIAKVQRTNVTTYLVTDENGRNVFGCVNAQQLSTVNYPDVFVIEKY